MGGDTSKTSVVSTRRKILFFGSFMMESDFIIVLFSLQISVMTKLVPSPDWFIGLDSLDLCSQGSFVESVTTEVSIQAHCIVTG